MSDAQTIVTVQVAEPYRVQNGCWNCLNHVREIGPDGSDYLFCTVDAVHSGSASTVGKLVQAAGVCGKWQVTVSSHSDWEKA